MSPLRWDVLVVGFVLALPVFALGLRGDLSPEDMMTRVLWCLGAGWAVVAVFRLATTPPAKPAGRRPTAVAHPAHEPDGAAENAPAV